MMLIWVSLDATMFVVMVARRESLGGVAQRVLQARPDGLREWATRARVDIWSQHWFVRKARPAPTKTSSSPSACTVTVPPPSALPDTGAAPQAAGTHCCTVKLSVIGLWLHVPSKLV